MLTGFARSLLSDALLISISNSILKASNAITFIIIVHALGKTVAGQFSITTSYVAVALGLALLGLDEILIREAKHQEGAVVLFMNFLVARIGLTLLSTCLLIIFLWTSRVYDSHLRALILLYACGQIGDGILILSQTLFVTQNRTNFVLLTSTCISTIRILASLFIVKLGGKLNDLFLSYVITSYAGAGLAFWIVRRYIFHASLGSLFGFVNFSYIVLRVKQSLSFFWINLFVLLEFQMDVILLSVLGTVSDVALYSSALTIFTAVWIIPQAYRTALYVQLAKAFQQSRLYFWRLFRRSVLASFGLGVIAGLLLAVLAPLLFQTLYPADYDLGIPALRILAIQLLIAFANAPGTRALLTLRLERLGAVLTALSLVLNVVANLILIPHYGPLGAAGAKAISGAVFYALTHIALLLAYSHSIGAHTILFCRRKA